MPDRRRPTDFRYDTGRAAARSWSRPHDDPPVCLVGHPHVRFIQREDV
ncbi:MAG TPA: hypothetical protein VF595_17565 [Tepidisphaeraceae bacterium]